MNPSLSSKTRQSPLEFHGLLFLSDFGLGIRFRSLFQMLGRFGDALSKVRFTVGYDAIADFLDMEPEPHRGIRIPFVASGAVGVDATGLEQ